jgi:protein-disulfide isomerase
VNCSSIVLAVSGLLLSTACTQENPTLPSCVVPIGDSPTRGPADAWVTAVEFADFQCPYCGQAESTIHQVDAQRPGVVRWVWKNLPITSIHPRALPAAIAAECAFEQNRFWEMHDLLFQHQDAQSDADLANYAQQIGLDMTTWQACLSSAPPQQRISADEDAAAQARVDATPTFFFNGIAVVGAVPLEDMLGSVDAAQRAAQSSGQDAGIFYSLREGQGCRSTTRPKFPPQRATVASGTV